jgi:cytoskeletal protein CcmA (bactofilin family)
VSAAPIRPNDYEPTRGAASIGNSVTIKGQIFSREDLLVDGEVEGAIEVTEHRFTVGPNGRVRAGVKAREIVVLGSIEGNVEAVDKIDIRKDARLIGDIKTSRIVIEDGAYFKGSIDIVRSEAKQQAGQQARPQSVSTGSAAAQPAPVTTNSAR